MKQTSNVASFFIFPTLVFLIHLTASKILNLYTIFPNLDIPFHYIGGLSIGYTSAQILSYLEQEKFTARLNRVIFTVLIISLTATAAVVWEFAEFIGDQLWQTNIQVSLANTMQDQFLGVLGGMTIAYRCFKKPKTDPLSS
jgi:uncharacterized membrane protein